jgi:ribonuclease P/MRP protein subunit POP7
MDIAREVEEMKKWNTGGPHWSGDGRGDAERTNEEVVLKASGKAIPRVMEMGVWFQQRAERYRVRIKTGSVGCVDDVEMPEDEVGDGGGGGQGEKDAEGGAHEAEPQSEDVQMRHSAVEGAGDLTPHSIPAKEQEEVPETRVRCVSVLEVYVSLR